MQKPWNSSRPHKMRRCNIPNKNLHYYPAKTFIASFLLFRDTNPRQLFNELAFYRVILHRMRN